MSAESEEVMRREAYEAEIWELRRSKDIVDRLRVAAHRRPSTSDPHVTVHTALLLEAADEIEALRTKPDTGKGTLRMRWESHPDGPLPYA